MSQRQERGAGQRAVRRHRRAGRGRQQGRGPRQQVPGPHPRGRRHRVRAAGLRRRRRARPVRPARAPRASSRSSSRSPTSRPSRTRSRSGARRPSRTESLADEVAALDAGAGRSSEAGTPIYRSDLDRGRPRAAQPLLPAHQQAGDGGGQRRRGPARATSTTWSRPVVAELGGPRRGHRHVRAARGRGRPARRRRAGRDARGARARRGRAAPLPPHRLPPARAAHLLHHRREGVPGLDVPGRLEGAAVRRA